MSGDKESGDQADGYIDQEDGPPPGEADQHPADGRTARQAHRDDPTNESQSPATL